jgi:hypothetical protein
MCCPFCVTGCDVLIEKKTLTWNRKRVGSCRIFNSKGTLQWCVAHRICQVPGLFPPSAMPEKRQLFGTRTCTCPQEREWFTDPLTLLSTHSVGSSTPYVRRRWAVREGVMTSRHQNVFRQFVIVAYHVSLLALVIHSFFGDLLTAGLAGRESSRSCSEACVMWYSTCCRSDR